MITIKNKLDIEKMRVAGNITKKALEYVGEKIKAGVTTAQLDKYAHDFITANGGTPSFLNYNGFPASICSSINDEVVHGIPSGTQVIKDGDIVSIDLGACVNGFHGDCARTFLVGEVAPDAKRLVEVTKASFFEGIKFAKVGYRIGDISAAIEDYVTAHGYSVVVDLVGHGIGRNLHEDPSVPNFGVAGRGPRLTKGMTIAIEPMVNAGNYKVKVMPNKWTIKTIDGSLSAHYENTILITDDEPEILTKA